MHKKQELLTFRKHLSSFPVFWLGPCCSSFQFFVLSYYASLLSEFRVVVFVTISTYKRCSVRLYFQLFVSELLFTLFGFVYVQCCPTNIVQCFCFVCLRLVYPILPVSLDCPVFIVPSIFSYGSLLPLFCRISQKKPKGFRFSGRVSN
jgi:hypothetical protein